MADGQIVGVVKRFHVPQPEKIKMGVIAMDVVSLAMLCVRMTIHLLHPISGRQSAEALPVLKQEATVGALDLPL